MTNESPEAHRGCVLSEYRRPFAGAVSSQICQERFCGSSLCHCPINAPASVYIVNTSNSAYL